MYSIKRLIDSVISLTALILLMPFLLILALLIRIRLGSPVLFTQERPGLKGKVFRMVKFRSMTNARDGEGNLLPDDMRLTRFGKRLRSSSLDELPELWNVLKGEMSIVGPRPLLVEYLSLYSEEQNRRHDVSPGITGWAQVNGRNAISWDEKFALDVWYVDHWSIWLDFCIIAKTVKSVIVRKDITAQDHVTMHPFKGSADRVVKRENHHQE